MINAIKYMDDLEQTGFTQEQAKTTVNLWLELMNDNLATKNDLKDVRTEIKELETSLRNEIGTVRQEMKQMENKIQNEFALVRHEIKDMGNMLTIKLGGLMTLGLTLIAAILKF